MELSEYTFETLRTDGEFVLYRGRYRRHTDASPRSILVMTPVSERPALRSLRRMEHEYSLMAELDPAWAVQPLALTSHKGRMMLILSDPGGEPLDLLLGRPMELIQFLRPAVGVSAALGQLHGCGLVHKDVKPANILVNRASGEARLTGFGIASHLPRERQSPAPPESIAGTLAYMAPEQTGRMNRSIDSRSDLYSLGVTLYQMLTGSLPFTASDPMEWVHCHIARKPISPSERSKDVPAPVSAIITKLLAKTAEERYQTAAGVESDLRRCLAEWETQRRIDEFPLGEDDTPDRLLIPEKLYGRASEVDILLASFDRIVKSGPPELVLVSGYSGIGKSSVVNELHKMLVPTRGLFASGKFDQYKRDIPYSTLAQAFQSLVRPLLGKSDAELASWRDALHEALGPNSRLMVDVVPELKLIIGEQSRVPELPPQQAQSRFQLVFRRFIGVFALPEHPLALFLDDLQWLDTATLDLLEDLLTRSDLQQLMLIGAFRDNEVDAAHPLARKLAAIKNAGGRVEEITLAPLAREHLGQLIADALRCETELVAPLAQLVHEKTGGNPFFAIQFISTLVEEGLLTYDHEAARWSWDLNRIHAKGYTDNVVHLMIGKLTRLPSETQQALQQMACLGNVAEITMLSTVLAISEEQVHALLWTAVRQEFVERQEFSYKFIHDRVQEAAYSLIPEELRAGSHLRIGRLLAAHTPSEKQEEAIFEIVNQLNRGAALITAPDEREQLAELNLIAARRAKTATAYASALTYLTAGAALLPEDTWERRHELTFALELNRAECEFLTGALAEADQRVTALSARSTTTLERASVTCLRADLYTTLDQNSRAVAVGLDYLRHLGIDWSPHPTEEEARREYERIWSQLGNRSIEDLIELPLMTDPSSLATLDVLTKLATPAWHTDANLLSLVVCRAVNLSLEGGNCDGSCYAYVVLGLLAGPRFGDYQAGFRFGRPGYELVEQRGLKRFQARTYFNFGSIVTPWTRHVRTGRDLVRRAFEAANNSGDLTFAAYCCTHLNTNFLAAGDPLDEVQGEAERGLAFAQKMRFGFAIDSIAAQLALIRTLRGSTPNFGCFDHEQFDELQMEHRFSSNPDLALPEGWYWIRKLQARFFAGDYAAALEAASKAKRLLWTSPSMFETAEYHFYAALSQAAASDSAASEQRGRYVKALVPHHRQLEIWAANCPDNFENRAALVGAEIARIDGRDLEAMRLYEEAIRSARQHGFVHNEGLAHEVAARFYTARGFETFAHTYRRNARDCYLRWGAEGKVRQLEQLHAQLREDPIPAPATDTMGAPLEQLDVETVVKASQTLSSEMVLPILIERLMRITVEHAGAERGLLVLLRGDKPLLEAEAVTGPNGVEVNVRQEGVTPSDLPQSALHYVIRTRERVVLDDASISSSYSEDVYVRHSRPRSVLCLPIIQQTKLVGALYLENNLTPGAFTSERVAVLELLASQAAISLENARLYSDLQRNEAFLVEGQSISSTGSFGWNVATGEIYWSEETYKIFEYDRAANPSLELVMQCTHPDDRELVQETIDHASRERINFDFEHRLLMPDGVVKHLHVIAHVLQNSSGNLEFVGAVMDVTATKQGEEALRKAQTDLAHVSRVTTMGELVASIAHEVNQPLGAIVTNGHACLHLLSSDLPDLNKSRKVIERMINDGMRAGEVIKRIRDLLHKAPPQKAPLNINETVQEVIALASSDVLRSEVELKIEMASDLPLVMADRIQLQQVILNLILNARDAMREVGTHPRELLITTLKNQSGEVVVAVRDSGKGLNPKDAERIFDPFFTTKPDGMGLGLSISRRIIEDHGGKLWATANEDNGTTLQFTLPPCNGSAVFSLTTGSVQTE